MTSLILYLTISTSLISFILSYLRLHKKYDKEIKQNERARNFYNKIKTDTINDSDIGYLN